MRLNRWPNRAEVCLNADKNGFQAQNENRNSRPNRPKRQIIRSEAKSESGIQGFSAACKARGFYRSALCADWVRDEVGGEVFNRGSQRPGPGAPGSEPAGQRVSRKDKIYRQDAKDAKRMCEKGPGLLALPRERRRVHGAPRRSALGADSHISKSRCGAPGFCGSTRCADGVGGMRSAGGCSVSGPNSRGPGVPGLTGKRLSRQERLWCKVFVEMVKQVPKKAKIPHLDFEMWDFPELG